MTVGENKKSVVKELKEIIGKHNSDAKISLPNVEGVSWKATKFYSLFPLELTNRIER
ncbi:MAG: hypothetical protein AB1432_08495 [Bacteroidota bacterium]|jgi:hypothetical protein